MSQKIKVIFITTLAIGFLLTVVSPVMAAKWLETILPETDGHLIPVECTGAEEKTTIDNCGTTQIFQTIVNFSKIILGLTGSVALAMFMFGGILFIIAAGNQEKISKGKETMKTAAIGIIIILGAWIIVNFTILALTKGEVGSGGLIFDNSPWAEEQQIPTGGGINPELLEQLESLGPL